ncbi:hypothetical protein RR42_m1449 [Cupriavidus basilensis]|uniref:Uncharacterized protein n=1 Tax=Cupriavidus basilensis TaxID=68895 RepID=A0A0C4Y742_9BURK|nr:hypothetical protein RR42_m1449 [Cupriavidus basilensis]
MSNFADWLNTAQSALAKKAITATVDEISHDNGSLASMIF